MRVNDAVFGVVLLLAALAIYLTARSFPDMPGQDFGPALFPSIVAAGFAICGILLVVSGIRLREVHGLIELGEWARREGHVFDVGLVIGGLIVLILVWDILGFIISGTLFLGILMTRFRGGRIPSSFAMAFATAFLVDWGFRGLLLVPLPLGPLTGLYW